MAALIENMELHGAGKADAFPAVEENGWSDPLNSSGTPADEKAMHRQAQEDKRECAEAGVAKA
jgi:hypothetical protein